MNKENLVETTKNYYDSQDADHFYHTIWGGEDIHVGIYQQPDDPILEASRRTVRRMLSQLGALPEGARLLDLGAGYGGAARQIALQRKDWHIECLNLSEAENQRNREKTAEAGLNERIQVHGGNFENIPWGAGLFDVVWSEDAFLHSDQKAQILQEAARVLKPGGQLIFTDPMQADDCPEGVLDAILRRIHLRELCSVARYRQMAQSAGLQPIGINEMPGQLTFHYQAVLRALRKHFEELQSVCSASYLQNMQIGLQHWIEGGQKGYLNWGILHFRKEA